MKKTSSKYRMDVLQGAWKRASRGGGAPDLGIAALVSLFVVASTWAAEQSPLSAEQQERWHKAIENFKRS